MLFILHFCSFKSQFFVIRNEYTFQELRCAPCLNFLIFVGFYLCQYYLALMKWFCKCWVITNWQKKGQWLSYIILLTAVVTTQLMHAGSLIFYGGLDLFVLILSEQFYLNLEGCYFVYVNLLYHYFYKGHVQF